MIILCVTLLALLIAVSAVVVRFIFRPKWVWLNYVIIFMLSASLMFGLCAATIANSSRNQVKALQDEYDNIMLYHYTISNAMSEPVRFDFYQRIIEFNEAYNDMLEASQSAWVGALYDRDWNANMTPILFDLHGEDFYINSDDMFSE